MSDVVDDLSRINRDYELSPGIHYALKTAATEIARLRAELAKVEGELSKMRERDEVWGWTTDIFIEVHDKARRCEAAEARALAAEARMGEVVKASKAWLKCALCGEDHDNDLGSDICTTCEARAEWTEIDADEARIRSALAKDTAHDH